MSKKCKPDCIYFPQIIDENIEYYIDKYGVKHKTNSQLYICMYTGQPINKKQKCKYRKTSSEIKEKMKQSQEGSE